MQKRTTKKKSNQELTQELAEINRRIPELRFTASFTTSVPEPNEIRRHQGVGDRLLSEG